MCEEEVDLDEHWSYTIMGNWRALQYCEELTRICIRSRTPEEKKFVKEMNHFIPIDLWESLIDRSYDKLLNFVRFQHSRLAYLVLGVFIMKFGGKMTREVKEKILEYSDWRFEENQFKTKEEKKLRKKYLFEFRDKIANYRSGEPILISDVSLSDVYANHGPFNLSFIKYDI